MDHDAIAYAIGQPAAPVLISMSLTWINAHVNGTKLPMRSTRDMSRSSLAACAPQRPTTPKGRSDALVRAARQNELTGSLSPARLPPLHEFWLWLTDLGGLPRLRGCFIAPRIEGLTVSEVISGLMTVVDFSASSSNSRARRDSHSRHSSRPVSPPLAPWTCWAFPFAP